MKELNKQYSVIDVSGLTWGTVELKWAKGDSLHGYLEASEEFSNIAPLFERHSHLMGQAHGNENELEFTANEIAKLGVALKSEDNDASIEAGTVFVSKTSKGLLFTCHS